MAMVYDRGRLDTWWFQFGNTSSASGKFRHEGNGLGETRRGRLGIEHANIERGFYPISPASEEGCVLPFADVGDDGAWHRAQG